MLHHLHRTATFYFLERRLSIHRENVDAYYDPPLELSS